VLDGRAHLLADSSAGRLTARIAGPGESLPLAALLGDGRLITTVKASTDMTVWQVNRLVLKEHFRTHCATGAHVYGKAAGILAERYRSTIWRLTQTTADVVKTDGFWANV
jgi:CRP-like cAMP-binding protein